jgi:hypothetical protein
MLLVLRDALHGMGISSADHTATICDMLDDTIALGAQATIATLPLLCARQQEDGDG